MRKTIYFLLLAAAVSAVACSQSELQEPEATPSVSIPSNAFGAGVEGATKVSIQSDYTLHWDENDGVAVWDGTAYTEYNASAAGAWTTLVGDEVDTELAHCAFYPYSADISFADNKVTAVIPSVQTPVKGNFPYNPSVAYASAGEKDLVFYNVCGLVGFEITKENISNVVIFGNAGESLTGKVAIPCNSTTPAAEVVEGVKSVTLQAETVFEKGVYYVAVLPQTFTAGITITMNGTDGSQDKRDSKPFTLHRSCRINANKIDEGDFVSVNEISNAAELQAFFNVVNADENKGAGMTAKLVADIDMTGVELVPAAEFAGTFDGSYLDGESTKNHAITNWNTTTALFGKVAATGVVKNLTVNGTLTINAEDDAAFIALDNAGTISYCTTQGTAVTLPDLTFTTERAVGAVAARTTGTIQYCENEAAITLNPVSTVTLGQTAAQAGECTGTQHIGGIAGHAEGSSTVIDNCTNSAQVAYTTTGVINSMSTIGGILGSSSSEIGTNVAAGTMSCNVTVSNCDNTGKIAWGYDQKPAGNAFNNICIGGVVGYLEGPLSRCTNSGEIYAHGYRSEASCYTKVIKLGGVAGVATMNVTDCTNSGHIDVSGTLTGGDTAAKYIGNSGLSAVGGVLGNTGSDAYVVSGCHNNAEKMDLDMHMLTTNGSQGAVGGVAAIIYSQIQDCDNKADINLETRFKYMRVGGIGGTCKLTKMPSDCNNYGDITCNAGTLEQSNTSQSCDIHLGGVFGFVEGCNLNITGVTGFANEGQVKFVGGNYAGTKYIGGILGRAEATGADFSLRGSETKPFGVNKGAIVVESLVGKAYIAGLHGYINFQADGTKGNTAVTMNYSRNEGTISVNTSATAVVAGLVGYYRSGCVYGSTNSGAITVNATCADLRVAGAVGDAANAKQMVGMINTAPITVTTDNAEGTVRVAGVRTATNGQINAASQRCDNSGSISLTTNAKTAYVAGVTVQDGATQINANSTGNVTYTYNGTSTPTVYASLGVAYRSGSTATTTGTYGGTLTLNNVTDDATCHCGLLSGYAMSSTGMKLTSLTIKKGTVINGVTVSDVDTDAGYYKSRSYLMGSATPTDAVLTLENISLAE